MKKNIFSILIVLLIGFQVIAQQRIKFEKLSVDKGMSQSSVVSIAQDSQGFMWFSTLDGLNKYDGYEFKVYWTKPNTPKVITDNITNILYETPDKQNPTLWIGTAATGLCRYNINTDDFTSFVHDSTNSKTLSDNIITGIVGNNETLWVGTYKGLNKFSQAANTFSYFSPKSVGVSDTILCVEDAGTELWIGTKDGVCVFDTKTEKFSNSCKNETFDKCRANSICVTQSGDVWIGTDKGLFRKDKKGEIENLTTKLQNRIKDFDYEITVILEDNNASIWLGTRSDGLFRYFPLTNELHRYVNDAADKSSISANSILSVYRDRADILWVGTSLGGVNKWNRAADNLLVFRYNPYDEYSLSAAQVRCFHTDREGSIWIGTVEGGLNRWDKGANKFIHYKHIPGNPNSLPNNHIRSIYEDKDGNFWIGTANGLAFLNRKSNKITNFKHDKNNANSLPDNHVWSIKKLNDTTLMIATFGGGLSLLNPDKKTFKNFRHNPKIPDDKNKTISGDQVTALLKTRDGGVWVGTFAGANIFYPKTGDFLHYKYQPENENSLSNNRVYSLHEDSEGYIWIGTKGGLTKFNTLDSSIKRFTTDNSDLPNNVILGILEESECLWVSTNNGISRMHKKTEKIKNFDMGDGLQSNEFLAGAAHKSSAGEMFFGGIDGFNAFFPDKIKDNPHQPSVLITKIEVKNKPYESDTAYSMNKVIELQYFENDISFEFVALDFIFPEKNRYAYQLVGYDKEFNHVEHQRFAKYTNLPPGTYTFRVIGSNNDEVWNEQGATLTVIIHPAIWQTLWFKILSIALILFAIVAFYRIRVRAIKRQNEHLEDQVRKRTAEIRQQNDEIIAQRDEITDKKNHIEKQKQEIEDSIIYAKRIQTAAMPAHDYMQKNLPEHFVLFKPRDIVSGDFFWASKREDKIIITAADCTGHGVPGAFMSMLGISFLNKIVNERGVTDPGEILNQLRKNIIQALKQDEQSEDNSKDGMDISMTVIDLTKRKFYFSGAYNPLFIIKNKEAKTIEADRMPVAIYEHLTPFSVQEFDMGDADMIYMFSDGYPDQFGGNKGKKFMKTRFRNLLSEISDKDMKTQHDILDKTIEEWRGAEAQIDDIVVVGVKLI